MTSTTKVNEIIQNVKIISMIEQNIEERRKREEISKRFEEQVSVNEEMIEENIEISKRLVECEQQMSEQLSVNEEMSERLSFYERNESASMIGSMIGSLDDTTEDVADQKAITAGDTDKKFNDEQYNLLIEENSGYVFMNEDLKKVVKEKEETEKTLRNEIQALGEQNEKVEQEKANIQLQAHMFSKKVALSRCERFESKRLAKSTIQKKEKKIREISKSRQEMNVEIVELNSKQKETEEKLKIVQSRNEKMARDFDQKMVDLKMVMAEKTSLLIEQEKKIENLTEQIEMAKQTKDKKPRRVLAALKKFGL